MTGEESDLESIVCRLGAQDLGLGGVLRCSGRGSFATITQQPFGASAGRCCLAIDAPDALRARTARTGMKHDGRWVGTGGIVTAVKKRGRSNPSWLVN